MRFTIFGAVALCLSGCGVVYISPKVPADDPNVQVISLTADTIAQANASFFQPKSLPQAFSEKASDGVSLRGSGPLPAPIFTSEPQRPNAMVMNVPPSAPDLPYEIGVGDVVLLATASSETTIEQLSGLLAAQSRRQGYTVQDDGAISIPDVGRIELAGLTLEAAEAEVFQKLVENQVDPSFSIEIAEFNSKRVSLGGAVSKPTVVPITLTALTLEEAIAAAGGFNAANQDFASIRLYREGALYQVPLNDYYERPDIQKTRLAAGDSIFVDVTYDLARAQAYFQEQIMFRELGRQSRLAAISELNAEIGVRGAQLSEARGAFQARLAAGAIDRDYVYLTGEVASSARFALPFEQRASLADALFENGGFSTQTANAAQIYVLRGGADDRVNAYHLNGHNVTKLVLATKLEMRPDDIIFISEQPIVRWNRVLQGLLPTVSASGVQ